MLNLNIIPIPRNSSTNKTHENFPTVGLKSILQNSDLLDLLLKPMSDSNSKSEEKSNMGMMGDFGPELSGLNLDELLDGPTNPNKPAINSSDHDYIMAKNNAAKIFDDGGFNKQDAQYRNAFLGPSLWDKGEIFQHNHFGVEYLGIDEFLSDSNLNEADIEFLDGLKSAEPFSNGSSVNSVSPPATTGEFCRQVVDTTPMFSAQNDERKVVKKQVTPSSSAKMSMSTLLKEWNESNEEEEILSDSEDLLPAKKRLFNDRLVLQPALKKSKKQFVPNEMKDEKYWARRNKNNVAAKRSRETRRLKENQIVIAATYLEHENDQLQKQLDDYKEKCAELEKRLSHYEQI